MVDLGKTEEAIASKLHELGDVIDFDDMYYSSSMDFAKECGFKNDDAAKDLMDKAIELYGEMRSGAVREDEGDESLEDNLKSKVEGYKLRIKDYHEDFAELEKDPEYQNADEDMKDELLYDYMDGENINDLAEFMPLIDNGAVDIVEVGMGTTGLTGAMKVANMAFAYELPVAMMNCPGNTMSHLATNLPNHFMMEVVDNGRELFFDTDHHIEDGQIIIGNEPGFGISVDFDKLNNLKVDSHSTPKHESSPFPRREGAGLIIKPFEEGK